MQKRFVIVCIAIMYAVIFSSSYGYAYESNQIAYSVSSTSRYVTQTTNATIYPSTDQTYGSGNGWRSDSYSDLLNQYRIVDNVSKYTQFRIANQTAQTNDTAYGYWKVESAHNHTNMMSLYGSNKIGYGNLTFNLTSSWTLSFLSYYLHFDTAFVNTSQNTTIGATNISLLGNFSFHTSIKSLQFGLVRSNTSIGLISFSNASNILYTLSSQKWYRFVYELNQSNITLLIYSYNKTQWILEETNASLSFPISFTPVFFSASFFTGLQSSRLISIDGMIQNMAPSPLWDHASLTTWAFPSYYGSNTTQCEITMDILLPIKMQSFPSIPSLRIYGQGSLYFILLNNPLNTSQWYDLWIYYTSTENFPVLLISTDLLTWSPIASSSILTIEWKFSMNSSFIDINKFRVESASQSSIGNMVRSISGCRQAINLYYDGFFEGSMDIQNIRLKTDGIMPSPEYTITLHHCDDVLSPAWILLSDVKYCGEGSGLYYPNGKTILKFDGRTRYYVEFSSDPANETETVDFLVYIVNLDGTFYQRDQFTLYVGNIFVDDPTDQDDEWIRKNWWIIGLSGLGLIGMISFSPKQHISSKKSDPNKYVHTVLPNYGVLPKNCQLIGNKIVCQKKE